MQGPRVGPTWPSGRPPDELGFFLLARLAVETEARCPTCLEPWRHSQRQGALQQYKSSAFWICPEEVYDDSERSVYVSSSSS
eukprot:5578537-Pyramimonas_sp.AAC.1